MEHVRLLASVETPLPPIVVHRPTMRVLDGMHRLSAARLLGAQWIDVRFFDGSESDAFVLAVKANILHGRPLSLADRTTAAERVIASHPEWSTRAIAAATGISARLVAEVRRRIEARADGPATQARVGRDGRMRPVDHAEGRLRAAQIIRENPDASLRHVARQAGVSPATAHDVRSRMRRGEDPVRGVRRPVRRGEAPAPQRGDGERVPDVNLEAMMRGLTRDPSLRFTESGRGLLRWMLARVVRPEELRGVMRTVPTHSAYVVARIARQCADEWLQIADDLQRGTPVG